MKTLAKPPRPTLATSHYDEPVHHPACDRCAIIDRAGGNRLVVRSGSLTSRRLTIDLCKFCSAALAAWLDGSGDLPPPRPAA